MLGKAILKSSVTKQKGKSEDGADKKQDAPNFPKNEYFLPPDTHTYENPLENPIFAKESEMTGP